MEVQQTNDLHRLLWLANVQQFFPDKASSQIWNDYAAWRKNRDAFQQLYQRFPLRRLYDLEIPDLGVDPTGTILITFHYGPYRLLPKLLVRLGYRVSLLASAHILQREMAYYRAELEEAGSATELLECIDANSPSSLKKIVSGVRNRRVVIVMLDANEGLQQPAATPGKYTLAVPFGNHYLSWRTNIVKLAARFQIPMFCSFMKRDHSAVQWGIHPLIPIMDAVGDDSADELIQALSALQLAFQRMMKQGWIYWENWAFIHQYTSPTASEKKGMTAAGSWLIPWVYQQKKYLFDVYNRQFFKIED